MPRSKKYQFSNAVEREEKKVIARKINNLIKNRKLQVKDLKRILKMCVNRISAVKQMDLSRFTPEELEGFLEQIKEG